MLLYLQVHHAFQKARAVQLPIHCKTKCDGHTNTLQTALLPDILQFVIFFVRPSKHRKFKFKTKNGALGGSKATPLIGDCILSWFIVGWQRNKHRKQRCCCSVYGNEVCPTRLCAMIPTDRLVVGRLQFIVNLHRRYCIHI